MCFITHVEHEDVHSQDENVDAGGGGVHPQNGSKEILFVSSGKLHEPYAFCNQVDDATTDTVASHVHARLGLAGRRRGGGFNVSGGVVHGSSGRARTSLGLTRRGRATNGQQAVEHGLQAESSNVAEPARFDVNRAEQGGHDEGGSSVPRGKQFCCVVVHFFRVKFCSSRSVLKRLILFSFCRCER